MDRKDTKNMERMRMKRQQAEKSEFPDCLD
jgi:hypothetical protein